MRRLFAIVAFALLAGLCAAHAADRRFTTSDGVRLHYIEQGQGDTIVLVPGWTMPAWIWDAQIAAFAARYHVVAFDPRSQGDSDVAPTGHEPYRRGQDIAELLAQLPPEPVLLVGWSLGVLDVLAYVHEHGDARIAGLVLVDNSVGEDPPPAAVPAPRGRHRPAVHVSREEAMRSFVRGMFVATPLPSYVDRLTEAALHTPAWAAAALLAYPVPRTFWREALYSTARPVLYIVRPQLTGQAANVALHDPAAETVVMQGVGHALFVEDPSKFNSLLASFIHRRLWR